jgi:salicylate hydroxylase
MTLRDGTVIKADVILAADGINSTAVQTILGKSNPPQPAKHSNCCYRFLLNRKDLESDPETKWFTEGYQSLGCRIYPDHAANRRLVSYTCREYAIPVDR